MPPFSHTEFPCKFWCKISNIFWWSSLDCLSQELLSASCHQQLSFWKRDNFVTVWFPSSIRRCFSLRQYAWGLTLSVNTATTSMMEKYHFSCSSSHTVRTFFSSNILMDSFFVITNEFVIVRYTLMFITLQMQRSSVVRLSCMIASETFFRSVWYATYKCESYGIKCAEIAAKTHNLFQPIVGIYNPPIGQIAIFKHTLYNLWGTIVHIDLLDINIPKQAFGKICYTLSFWHNSLFFSPQRYRLSSDYPKRIKEMSCKIRIYGYSPSPVLATATIAVALLLATVLLYFVD